VSFAVITLCVASQQVFIVYFVVDSVWKLLDTPSYIHFPLPVLSPCVKLVVSPIFALLILLNLNAFF
jgi:hypothetical protein